MSNKELESHLTKGHSCCSHESAGGADGGEVKTRKLPAWAIAVAIAAFVIFNALFLVFAMQMGSGNPG